MATIKSKAYIINSLTAKKTPQTNNHLAYVGHDKLTPHTINPFPSTYKHPTRNG
jgi:hypothetical protein